MYVWASKHCCCRTCCGGGGGVGTNSAAMLIVYQGVCNHMCIRHILFSPKVWCLVWEETLCVDGPTVCMLWSMSGVGADPCAGLLLKPSSCKIHTNRKVGQCWLKAMPGSSQCGLKRHNDGPFSRVTPLLQHSYTLNGSGSCTPSMLHAHHSQKLVHS
jgi:hypothetical protein